MTLSPLAQTLLHSLPWWVWRTLWLPADIFSGGHAVLPAAATLICQGDKILVVERSFHGGRCLPGGLAKPNESAAAAAVRETYEETGYDVRLLACLGTYPAHDRRWRAHVTVYRAELMGGTLRPSPEGQPLWTPWQACLNGMAFQQERILLQLMHAGVLSEESSPCLAGCILS